VFDFRYHVASLIAVFIALVIGILVGIGLSGRGFVSDAERSNLEHSIAELRSDRDAARAALAVATRRQSATEGYADATYLALVRGRLAEKRIAVIYVGSVDRSVDSTLTQTVRAAGGRILRLRAFRLPIDDVALQRILGRRPPLRDYVGRKHLRDVGHDLGLELALGGATPLLDALSNVLLEERDGSGQSAVDAVVVSRPAPPQQGATQDLLRGLYSGLSDTGLPVVGIERSEVARSAIPAFIRGGLSTVDSVDTSAGRVALVLELAGAAPGHYGVNSNASDGVLPPVAPLATQAG
jgi:hypothetical protein